ncbi:uncharacterized protein LOC124289615 isoform X2 [Haliotis rubra]|uniref:uncharacterized protein LOC124289615 isoform X2 n=1 Tax=Haliotis rubra TaxID=36100 RepID=UPI001EE5C561|nr:uncharacterized protein LOC124289615 isoform X2 [Haliotis rubra]
MVPLTFLAVAWMFTGTRVPKTNIIIIGILGVIIGILAAAMFCTALTRCVRHRRHIAGQRRGQLAAGMSSDLGQVSQATLGYRDVHRYYELHDMNPGLPVSRATHEYQVVHRYYEIHDEDIDPELPTSSTNNMVDMENGETMGEGRKKEEEEEVSEVGEVGEEESEPAATVTAEYFLVSSDVEGEKGESSGERKGKRIRERERKRMGKGMGREMEPAIPALAECFPVSSDVEEEDATSGSSAEDDTSYTRMLRDVFAIDPTTVVTYLTPRERMGKGESKGMGKEDEEGVSEVEEEESEPAAIATAEYFLMSSNMEEEK